MNTALDVFVGICLVESTVLSVAAIVVWRRLLLVAIRRWRVQQEINAMNRLAREVFSELR